MGDTAVRVRIQRLPHGEGLPYPAAATPGAAGRDLCAALEEHVVIAPGERALVPTGFAIALPEGYEAQVRPRSGLALRHGITLPNTPGTIDSDYRGEIRVILWNTGDRGFGVERGDRIAQLVVAPVARIEWQDAATLDEMVRGGRGFGSTGARARRSDYSE